MHNILIVNLALASFVLGFARPSRSYAIDRRIARAS